MTLSTRLQKFTLALLWLTLKLFEQSAKFAYRQVMASRPQPAIASVPASPIETTIDLIPIAVEVSVPVEPLASPLPLTPQREEPAIASPAESITATSTNHPNRATLVSALLDEAWVQGRRTYPQLIDYVREQSGTGCRRQTIKDWKVSRGLINAQGAQAEAS